MISPMDVDDMLAEQGDHYGEIIADLRAQLRALREAAGPLAAAVSGHAAEVPGCVMVTADALRRLAAAMKEPGP